jgi:hypothetical protein
VAEEQLLEILEVILISHLRELFQSTSRQKKLMARKQRCAPNASKLKTKKLNTSFSIIKIPYRKVGDF